METFLYLTTTGRSTGNPHQIEIWFTEGEGCYYLCAEKWEEADWVKNIHANPSVKFSIGNREDHNAVRRQIDATARILTPEQDDGLIAAVRPLFGSKYGWSDGLLVAITAQNDG
jgi:deazaflavin-dependent oxidoreductase (nitroreductase family)